LNILFISGLEFSVLKIVPETDLLRLVYQTHKKVVKQFYI